MKMNLAPEQSDTLQTIKRSHGARWILAVATEADRQVIYQHRHEVYGRELRQHGLNPAGQLRDSLDDWNVYLVVRTEEQIAGFVSITPPGRPSYSIDKYFPRETLPFSVDGKLFEVRL